MLVFAMSDKGGTGRSVTGCNLAYRRALTGSDVCYVDFDFGSPTAGAIFEVKSASTGTLRGGVHSFLQGRIAEPVRLNVWAESDRDDLKPRPVNAGQLVLFPGDSGGGEFPMNQEVVGRCLDLLLKLEEEFEISFIDLSAGRSHAIEAVLEVTGRAELSQIVTRWMVFHRWTRQHIMAAADLVFGERGLVKTGIGYGHDAGKLRDSIRFVRTAVHDPGSPELSQLRAAQAAWLVDTNQSLKELATRYGLGRSVVLGQTPMDHVLQWQEQLISNQDTTKAIANSDTVAAFEELARRLTDDSVWEGL
ncbi:MAG TPA: SCO2523 family variant P-loop protein [Pseudonocardiaceae bacterium]|jgi:hypothetical protein